MRLDILVSVDSGEIRVETRPGKSSLLISPLGLRGTASTNITSAERRPDGSIAFSLVSTATNGLSFLPGAPKESIDQEINFVVTPDKKVGLEGGARDGYPSLGIYAYRDVGGAVLPVNILELDESDDDDDLAYPMEQVIPAVDPQ